MTEASLRPHQQQIMSYRSGKMGISAVPGSGKTFTLSHLAAQLILSGHLRPDQEVLIVTFANSAVDNFSHRISQHLKDAGFLPGMGYTVRTLHGLAHDILRERPELAGLSNDFRIIDEREATQVKSRIVANFLSASDQLLTLYGRPEDSDAQKALIRDKYLPTLLSSLANAFIRTCKDLQLTPEQLKLKFSASPLQLPLVDIGIQLYTDYQRALHYNNGVDFDDLIRLALQCLQFDPQLVSTLRDRWPYILEDEAQDSSRLQQQILSLLSGEDGNWVRVGDPNQAIYETFTTADPRLLREFIQRDDVISHDLPASGRSTQSIISLANFLIDWVQNDHLSPFARHALTLPHIQPSGPTDPQPNPPDNPQWIELLPQKFSSDEETVFVAKRAAAWLEAHPDHTVVVLALTNSHGFKLIEALKNQKLPVIDSLLSSSNATRVSAGAISHILRALSDPLSIIKLAKSFEVWRRAAVSDDEKALTSRGIALIKRFKQVEDFLWPIPHNAWLDHLAPEPPQGELLSALDQFRAVMQRWQLALSLPIDQLILTIAQHLFLEPGELAMAHKLARTLQDLALSHPEWELQELTEELQVIARNERRFIGLSDDDSGFDPQKYAGQVVVSTIHRAKGLEWDKVFLTSVNNYDFPSGTDYDSYYAERWYIRNNLNLEAEILAQLNVLLSHDPFAAYTEGQASELARQEFIRERLRLLYVAITRAKQSLTLTWNTGRPGTSTEALPFVALRNFWQSHSGSGQ